MTLSSVIFGFSGLLISFTISTILNLIYSLLTSHNSNFRSIFAISLFSFSYLGIFGSLAMLMLRTEEGAGRVFLFIAITALSDQTNVYLLDPL